MLRQRIRVGETEGRIICLKLTTVRFSCNGLECSLQYAFEEGTNPYRVALSLSCLSCLLNSRERHSSLLLAANIVYNTHKYDEETAWLTVHCISEARVDVTLIVSQDLWLKVG